MAKAAAESDDVYDVNVKALEDHQPEDIDYTDIASKLGVPWIPGDDMEEFVAHLLNRSADDYSVRYSPELGKCMADYARGGNHAGYLFIGRAF